MLQFEDILRKETDPVKAEALAERLELVAHKLKFMDAVPVAISDTQNMLSYALNNYLEPAGGYLINDFQAAVYILYYEASEDLNALLAQVPGQLDMDWDAYKNKRIGLINGAGYDLSDPEQEVQLVEDLAEILHPGVFIFGQEGGNWVRFGG